MSDECVRPRRRSEIDQGDAIVDIDRMSFDNSQASRVATDHFGGYPPGKRSDNRVGKVDALAEFVKARVQPNPSPSHDGSQLMYRTGLDEPARNSGRTLRLRYLSISRPAGEPSNPQRFLAALAALPCASSPECSRQDSIS